MKAVCVLIVVLALAMPVRADIISETDWEGPGILGYIQAHGYSPIQIMIDNEVWSVNPVLESNGMTMITLNEIDGEGETYTFQGLNSINMNALGDHEMFGESESVPIGAASVELGEPDILAMIGAGLLGLAFVQKKYLTRRRVRIEDFRG